MTRVDEMQLSLGRGQTGLGSVEGWCYLWQLVGFRSVQQPPFAATRARKTAVLGD